MISQRWILLGLLAALTLLGACSADQGEAQKEVAAAAQGHEDHKDGEKGEEGHADEPDSGHADEHAEGEEGHEDEEASPLTLSAEQLDAAGVRFETLAPMGRA